MVADEGIEGRRNQERQAAQEVDWRHDKEVLALASLLHLVGDFTAGCF